MWVNIKKKESLGPGKREAQSIKIYKNIYNIHHLLSASSTLSTSPLVCGLFHYITSLNSLKHLNTALISHLFAVSISYNSGRGPILILIYSLYSSSQLQVLDFINCSNKYILMMELNEMFL